LNVSQDLESIEFCPGIHSNGVGQEPSNDIKLFNLFVQNQN